MAPVHVAINVLTKLLFAVELLGTVVLLVTLVALLIARVVYPEEGVTVGLYHPIGAQVHERPQVRSVLSGLRFV
jgi:uncharacterized membrane protein